MPYCIVYIFVFATFFAHNKNSTDAMHSTIVLTVALPLAFIRVVLL